jgi:2-oxoglutarate dehydrogenase E1 component
MISLNAAFEEEYYIEYLKNPNAVSAEWKEYFDKTHGKTIEYVPAPIEKKVELTKTGDSISLQAYEVLEPISGIKKKISDNMIQSLNVPTATSVREIPVKPLDENRRIINKYLQKLKKNKVSFTHVISWAIVRALIKFPQMNDSYAIIDGEPNRVRRSAINFGVAVDVFKKDGSRLLMVPSVKNAQNLNFTQFVAQMDELISKARQNKLDLNDLSGATVSITNPGMVGTTHSIPRLMQGQGLIIAAGSIDYPIEFQAVRPEMMSTFAISKIVTITNTYDHRIIQGAESAEFLAYIAKMLLGEERFYDQIFTALKIPFEPVRWQSDSSKRKHFGINDPADIAEKGAHAMLMINAFRVRGHLLADINPLGQTSYFYPELDPAHYGFSIWDLDRYFHADDLWNNEEMQLRDIIELLRDSYCGKIGYEFMHIQNPDKKEWIKAKLELFDPLMLDEEDKKHIFKKALAAEEFENFLHTKFVGHKRFSLEGGEGLVVMLDKILEKSADNGMNTAVVGMSHRGRLNVLVNNINKHVENVFDEFDGYIDSTVYHGSGDVKYHLGYESTFRSRKGSEMNVFLAPNPSHLELVDPLIEGVARAISNKIGDKYYTQVIPILVHGDAAFAGQGIVAETLNLSELEGYKTGGTIHIVVNNQIGFTTTAESSRSTVYATDIAKMIQAPILHVNGSDPEAVVAAAEFAYEYRANFNGDVVIDMLCYRKYGHNEGDEPAYTQPLLYKKIKAMRPISETYQERLIHEKTINLDYAVNTRREVQQDFYDKFSNREHNAPQTPKMPHDMFKYVDTNSTENDLREIVDKITALPAANDFHANPKVKSLFHKRKEMALSEKPAIDWAMGEALAFGSLLVEGTEVRCSGQDTRRGTFSQRHSTITDMENEDIYIPLNNIRAGQAPLRIFDSPLSEMAVLGFEYGYSLIFKDGLTLWEAQFGDFANNAQTVVDQYLACAETKWGKESNLVMLLPHSYEGQGSEHSSARIERYLQLCADDNIIVANLTTPAQYFHILRRQIKANFRKPLILFTPKSMLRNPLAVSALSDFYNSKFYEIFDDEHIIDKNQVERIVLCSGKLYYDILPKKLEDNIKNVAVVRIEQLYPLDFNALNKIVAAYPNAKEIVWAQEEPKNQGAWNYIFPILLDIMIDKNKVKFVGRVASGATAPASYKFHLSEQDRIVREALTM